MQRSPCWLITNNLVDEAGDVRKKAGADSGGIEKKIK